jgi:hypothetical protein
MEIAIIILPIPNAYAINTIEPSLLPPADKLWKTISKKSGSVQLSEAMEYPIPNKKKFTKLGFLPLSLPLLVV